MYVLYEASTLLGFHITPQIDLMFGCFPCIPSFISFFTSAFHTFLPLLPPSIHGHLFYVPSFLERFSPTSPIPFFVPKINVFFFFSECSLFSLTYLLILTYKTIHPILVCLGLDCISQGDLFFLFLSFFVIHNHFFLFYSLYREKFS